jgi:hypothetical protein
MTIPATNLPDRQNSGGRISLASLFPIALTATPPAHLVVAGLPSRGMESFAALESALDSAVIFSRQNDTGRYLSVGTGYFDEITVEESVARRLSLRTAETLLVAELLQAQSIATLFAGTLATQDAFIPLPEAADLAVQPVETAVITASLDSESGATHRSFTVPVSDIADFSTDIRAPYIHPVWIDEAAQTVRSLADQPSFVQEIVISRGAAAVTGDFAYSSAPVAIPMPEAIATHSVSLSYNVDMKSPLMAGQYGPGGNQGGFQQTTPWTTTTTTTTPTTTTTAAAAVDVSHIATDVSAEVVAGVKTIALSSLFTVTASASNPTYLILSVLDREEYTAAATGATGSITGNGVTTGLSSTSGSDSHTLGIVFTYDSANGRYYNSTYGYFDALTYTSSSSAGDVTDLAVYATDDSSVASKYASNTYALTLLDSGGYVSTVTVATEASFTGTVPSQATPDSIEAIAKSFVGDAWNMNGCWTLASTIAAEAGASLPVASTYVGTAGQAGGEWIVAYDGTVSASSNWESKLTAGEFVVFETTSGTGHITFVVSGSGSSAELIDNVTYETASGTITNLANDGSSSDVVISAAHAASEEFSGVSASTVVIYELDTPIVTSLVTADTLALKASQSLSVLFSVTDPASKTITLYEVYDTNTNDSFSVNGVTVSAHTAATAAEASSLSAISLVAGATAGTDTVELRAYNGTYWGDWDAITVTVSGSTTSTTAATTTTTTTTTTTSASTGLTVATTAAQTATDGHAYSYTLASGTFTDTAGLSYTTTAYQTSGTSAVSWLHYNATTKTLSGTVPTGLTGSITLDIVATDTAGHTASDIFTLSFVDGTTSSVSLVGAATSTTEHLALS